MLTNKTKLAGVPWLSSLESGTLNAFSEIVDFQEGTKGALLFERGSSSQAFFILLSGQCVLDARRPAGPAALLGFTDFTKGRPYSYTVTIGQDVSFLHIERSKFELFTRGHPGVYRALNDAILGAYVPEARLARDSGKKGESRGIGLALGSGGARSFAHIGLLHALEDLRIKVDVIGGSSGGALIGAQYAMGRSVSEISKAIRYHFVESKSLLDFTLPMVSLVRGKRFYSMLENIFGRTTFEDLHIPFFCVTTNLTQCRDDIHNSGELKDRIFASMSIPGIGPPVKLDGELHVDGSVLTPVPVKAISDYNCTRIIGVEVSRPQNLSAENWDPFVSPVRLLKRRFFQRSLEAPSLLSLLYSSSAIAASQSLSEAKTLSDLWLAPPVHKFGLLEFSSFDEIVEAGYNYTMKELKNWKES